MREILFRGKFGNEWKYGFLSIEPKGLVIKEPYKNESSNVWHIDADTVGQYTGLTDKNGTKIFEGDIVRTKKYGKIVRHCNVNDYDTFKVIYAPAIFRIENKYRGFNLVGYGTDYEVIGNIHDNPELLEVSE